MSNYSTSPPFSTTVTFYVIAANSPQATTSGFEQYLLFLTQHFVQQGAKIYINAADKQHAEQIAESFWQAPTNQLFAHNLVGEGPKQGTPVEIGYVGLQSHRNRQLLINLAPNCTNFATTFIQVIDFVPCDEKSKQQAREKYKIYHQAGYQLRTIHIEHLT